jgi:hypothetical protein
LWTPSPEVFSSKWLCLLTPAFTKAGQIRAAWLPSFEHDPTTLAVWSVLVARNYPASRSARSPTTKHRSRYPHRGRVLSEAPTSTSLCSSHSFPHPNYAIRAILVRPGRARKSTDNAKTRTKQDVRRTAYTALDPYAKVAALPLWSADSLESSVGWLTQISCVCGKRLGYSPGAKSYGGSVARVIERLSSGRRRVY